MLLKTGIITRRYFQMGVTDISRQNNRNKSREEKSWCYTLHQQISVTSLSEYSESATMQKLCAPIRRLLYLQMWKFHRIELGPFLLTRRLIALACFDKILCPFGSCTFTVIYNFEVHIIECMCNKLKGVINNGIKNYECSCGINTQIPLPERKH